MCQLVPKTNPTLINGTPAFQSTWPESFWLDCVLLVFLKMYLNGDHLCISSTTHAEQRVGLKRHLCGSSWPPRRRPQPDLKFVTKNSNTFHYAHLKNFENIFEFSWFLLNIWKPSFHDINWNLSEFFKPNGRQIYPPKKSIHHPNIAKVFLHQLKYFSNFLAWVGSDKCKVEALLVRDWSVSAPAPAHRSPSWWSKGSAWFGWTGQSGQLSQLS